MGKKKEKEEGMREEEMEIERERGGEGVSEGGRGKIEKRGTPSFIFHTTEARTQKITF